MTIAQQRAHEDTLRGLQQITTVQDRAYQDTQARIAAEDQARAHSQAMIQRGWADIDKQHQRDFQAESNRIADARTAEDKRYQAAIDAIDKEITADQKIATQESDRLKAVQQLATFATSADDALGGAASHAIDIANTINGIQTTGTPSALPSQGQTYIRPLGGFATGGDIPIGASGVVGDAPGGGLTPYSERVTVTARGAQVTPIRDLSAQNGGTAHPAYSPTYNITIVQQPGEDAAALWARLKPMLDAYQTATSAATLHAATGGAR
jgi:hypothetical protein